MADRSASADPPSESLPSGGDLRALPPSPGPDYALGQDRRLHYAKHLRLLFERGRKLRSGPLTLIYYQPASADLPVSRRADAPTPSFPILVAFSVPKRGHRRATRRNRIKRLLREGYRRLCLPHLRAQLTQPLWLCWVWQSPQLPELAEVEQQMSAATSALCARLELPPTHPS